MSNLNAYPTMINNTPIPVPVSWRENPHVVESEGNTEAGTDIVDVWRVDKLTVNASYNVSSTWLATFKGWANELSPLTVKIYDATEDDYVTRYMRIRNFENEVVPYSDRTNGTVGLWRVTFDLIEF